MTQKLDSRIQSYLDDQRFKHLSAIQSQAMPVILANKDVIALSKTGTGKTLAYLLPLFMQIEVENNQVQVLILAPTQELILQIFQVAQSLQPYFPKVRLLKAAKGEVDTQQTAHMVIGSIGRIHQLFLQEARLRLESVKMLVIDEADMMLEADSLAEIELIRSKLPERLQTCVFSATLPLRLNTFMNRFMHHPKMIQIDHDPMFDPKHEHYLIPFKNQDEAIVLDLLKIINPSLALIFVKNFETLTSLSKILDEHHHEHIALHGKLSTRVRQQHIKRIQNDQIRLILATDVAARGLDFPMLSDVISLGIPRDLSFFVHRSGRTGRAGRSGRVFTFYLNSDDLKIRQLIKDGIQFKHIRLTDTEFKALKPYDFVFKHRPSELDKEIQKRVKSTSKEVKPGYKKKLARDIETMKRKHRRQIIQDNIKKLQKAKSKAKQKAETSPES